MKRTLFIIGPAAAALSAPFLALADGYNIIPDTSSLAAGIATSTSSTITSLSPLITLVGAILLAFLGVGMLIGLFHRH